MAKLYTNENFPLPVVEALRESGHAVLTTVESGKGNQAISDEDILDFAIEQERILITFNRKYFIRLHTEKPDHKGIIVCSVDADFKALAGRIHNTLEEQQDMNGQLVRINRPNAIIEEKH